MVRTGELDEEIDKTQGKINALNSKNYIVGLSRKDRFQLSFLQYKLNQLNLIEYSDEKYVSKVDEKRIKKEFSDKRW